MEEIERIGERVMRFVNDARVAQAAEPMGRLPLDGTDPESTAACPLALALGCEIRGSARSESLFVMHFHDRRRAAAVAAATGMEQHGQDERDVELPGEVIDLVVSLTFGLGIPDADGHLEAWFVPDESIPGGMAVVVMPCEPACSYDWQLAA